MLETVRHPLAIAMWDFSWLERRWPGAGYEDWGGALDELVERGYDAVRIDAFPHLVGGPGQHAESEWELRPVWDQHAWGAPGRVRVRVQPELNEFITQCGRRDVKVALSSWFRDDTTAARMAITSPRHLADLWAATLDGIAADGLLQHIFYVDLCNEYAMPLWAPWLYGTESGPAASRTEPWVERWAADSIASLRERYSRLPLCMSLADELGSWREQDVSFMDLLELHLWMTQEECSDFYARLGYELGPDGFDPAHYAKLVDGGERLYRRAPEHWQARLTAHIENAAAWSRHAGKPLMTTESWAIINYKDWPGLDWGWVKDLCAHGVHTALRTGRWMALCTSNFCGPQFAGMWRDIGWHRELTTAIHEGPLPPLGTDAGQGTAEEGSHSQHPQHTRSTPRHGRTDDTAADALSNQQ